MGKLVANFFISLDGVVESPDQWHFGYFNEQMGEAVGKGFATTSAMLMGRKLYDEWAAYWPTSEDPQMAGMMNGMAKYVVSSSLTDPEWENSTVVPGDPDKIRELKDQTEGDISMSGSATTVRWLLENDLLDELRLLVHPVAVGKGQRLFEEGQTVPLKLIASETFDNGVLDLTYVKDPNPPKNEFPG
jgi:dihydrofolate reductase